MVIAAPAPTARRRSATSARSTAATSGSTSACASSAPASCAWRPNRVRSRGGDAQPPRRDPPDAQGHAGRPAGRDARAARDPDACAPPSTRPATARSRRPRSSTRRCSRGGTWARAARLPTVRRAGQRARAALGHDRADRPARGHALPEAGRRCGSATSRTPTAGPPPARPAAGVPAGRHRARGRPGAGGHGRGDHRGARRSTPPG